MGELYAGRTSDAPNRFAADTGTLGRREIDKRERIEETNRFLADGGTLMRAGLAMLQQRDQPGVTMIEPLDCPKSRSVSE